MNNIKLQPVGNSMLTIYVPSTKRQYTLILDNSGNREYEFKVFGGASEESKYIIKHSGSAESCLEEFLYWCGKLYENPETAFPEKLS